MSDFAAQPYGFLGGPAPGGRVAGYLIEEQIGAGGMAVVFRARDEALGRWAAVKILSPAMASDAEFRVRFLRESRAVAAVDHPHIIPVYAAGETGKVLYIATRFIAGGDLGELLRRAGGVLPPDRAAALVSQVASALDAAHAAGLVHRDVKLGNILVDTIPGRPEHAYLSDFGLSKGAVSATGLTATGQFLGTPDYCAPEQIKGGAVGGRADQYALACVAFALLTGTLPFHRAETMATLFAHVNDPMPSLAALRPELPPAVDAVVARGLAKSPADRYERCGEFAAALRDVVASIGRAPDDVGRRELGNDWFGDDGPPQPAQATDANLIPSVLAPPPQAPPAATASGGPVRWESAIHPNAVIGGSAAAGGRTAAGGRAGRSRRRRQRRTAVLAGSAAAILAAACVTVVLALTGLPSLHTGTPALADTFTVPGGGTVDLAQFSPDGKLLAATDEATKGTEKIYVWDVANRKYLTTLAASTTPSGLDFPPSFSKDDSTLSDLSQNFKTNTDTIYRWNLSTGDRTTVRSFPASDVFGLSGDDSTLAVPDSSGKQIAVQHAGTGVVFARLTLSGNSTFANCRSGNSSLDGDISLDGDGSRLVIGCTNGIAYVWDVAKRKMIAELHYRYYKNVVQVPMLSPDGTTVAVYVSGSVPPTLLDVATRSNITPDDSRWPRGSTACVFSWDGRVCGTDRGDGETVDLWDVAAHVHLLTVTDPKDGGMAAVGPDDSEVAAFGAIAPGTPSESSQIFLWDVP